MSTPSWTMVKVKQVWWAVTDVGRLIWFCRAPFVAIAAGGLAIVNTDQARDIVIATASSQEFGLPIPIAVLLWATMGWYWSRITLEFARGALLRTPPASTAGGDLYAAIAS